LYTVKLMAAAYLRRLFLVYHDFKTPLVLEISLFANSADPDQRAL